MATLRPYPLLLEPVLLEKVWGGERLKRLGKRLPEGKPIGESWEVADLACTSPSGAGGEGICSRILNGELSGRTLHEAMQLWGPDLLGAAKPTPQGEFPLLVKLLDARENLSVQVHPSAAYAAAHAGCHLKTECWYVLEAAPGSLIYKGIRNGITHQQLTADLEAGRVVDDLIAIPAAAGDCHILPSGTCHALGAGVMVAEVQTPSDTTFRLFDWGRQGRQMHVADALECIILGPAPAATRRDPSQAWARLADTDSFQLHEGLVEALPTAADDRLRVVTVLDGSVRLGDVAAATGQTVVIPATCSGLQVQGTAGCRVLLTVLK